VSVAFCIALLMTILGLEIATRQRRYSGI